MNKINIFILEDEVITQELLKESLESLNFKVCGMAVNAEIALKEIRMLQPDIVILDIHTEGNRTGIWLGNQLDIPTIYLTAYSDSKTIKEAISTQPISYLVKPFNTNNLFIALELALEKIENKKQIIVKDRDKNTIVLTKDILFAKKEDQYLTLHLKDSKKLIRSSIKDFLKKVNSPSIMQVHRSYVVNKKFITAFNGREIRVGDNSIPISKTFTKDVLHWIND